MERRLRVLEQGSGWRKVDSICTQFRELKVNLQEVSGGDENKVGKGAANGDLTPRHQARFGQPRSLLETPRKLRPPLLTLHTY